MKMSEEQRLRQEICKVGKQVYKKDFVASNDGNFSVRLESGDYLVTPTNVSKGSMSPHQIVLINSDGEVLGDVKPSSEYKMHLQIYKYREDVKAIVHAHPPYSTAFAVAGITIDDTILPEMAVSIGKVPIVEYETPSTQRLADMVGDAARKHNAMLLANHGVVVLAEDLWSAYYNLERLEHVAKIIYLAKNLGTVNSIHPQKIDELHDAFPAASRLKT